MIEIARLRVFPSGSGFDLKFYNPSPNLTETFPNFLFFHQQTQNIKCNFSWKKDDVLVVIGYEARANSVEHSKELCSLIRRYCNQFHIRFSSAEMETPKTDDSDSQTT